MRQAGPGPIRSCTCICRTCRQRMRARPSWRARQALGSQTSCGQSFLQLASTYTTVRVLVPCWSTRLIHFFGDLLGINTVHYFLVLVSTDVLAAWGNIAWSFCFPAQRARPRQPDSQLADRASNTEPTTDPTRICGSFTLSSCQQSPSTGPTGPTRAPSFTSLQGPDHLASRFR